MLRLTVFTKAEELSRLTGVSCQELWEHGFDLDDWNWGIQALEPLREVHYYDKDDNECTADSPEMEYSEFVWKDGYESFFWKLSRDEDLDCTEYDGKFYYISHH